MSKYLCLSLPDREFLRLKNTSNEGEREGQMEVCRERERKREKEKEREREG